MEHKKAMNNRAASADEKALRDKKALELGPPILSYAPPLAPGERHLVNRSGEVVNVSSMRKKKKLRQSQI